MKLTAKKRVALGKKVKALRREGILPAVLFGGEGKATPLELSLNEFNRVYKEAGESTLLDLEVEGKKEKILISEVQHDPFGKTLHADLRRIEAGEKITADVPILIEGESPTVKAGEGVLLTLLDEIQVECLPQDLPHEIKVDVSKLTEVGKGVEIKDLPIDQTKVKVLEHEPNELVVKIDYLQEEEVEEAPVAEEEAIAAIEATREKPEGEEGTEAAPEGENQPAPKEGEKEEKTNPKQSSRPPKEAPGK